MKILNWQFLHLCTINLHNMCTQHKQISAPIPLSTMEAVVAYYTQIHHYHLCTEIPSDKLIGQTNFTVHKWAWIRQIPEICNDSSNNFS